MAMELQEFLAGDEAEPEEERHGRPGNELAEPAGGLELGFLDDVGRVDSPLEPAIEAEGDHPLQPVAVPVEEKAEAGRVTVGRSHDQRRIRVRTRTCHRE
jgi:hypothetical protein